MTTAKKRGAIKPFFGGNLLVYEVTDPELIVIDTPGDWTALSHLEKAAPVFEIPMNPEYLDGKKFDALEGEENFYIDGIFKQRDKDLLDFLGETCRGKFYAIYRDLGIVNNLHQELFIPLAQFKPGFDLGANPPKPPFRIEVIDAEAEVTIDSAALPSGAYTLADVVIPEGSLFLIVETAV